MLWSGNLCDVSFDDIFLFSCFSYYYGYFMRLLCVCFRKLVTLVHIFYYIIIYAFK
jgi:hypothetical protein